MHCDHFEARGADLTMPDLAASAERLASMGAAGASPAGLNEPPEMRTAGCNRPSADQTKNRAAIVGDTSDDAKALATLTAQFALLGYSLHELADGSLIACRWGYSRPLQSLYEARVFCRQIGGAR